MATFNQWGTDIDEELGDVIYDEVEEKAKQEAKELAEEEAKAAGRALDKLTDKIDPVKQAKDKVKDMVANNPIARAKRAVKAAADKVKKAATKLAREGIHAVGKAAVGAAKGLISAAAANPVAAVIIIVIIVVLICLAKGEDDGNTNFMQDDDVLLESSSYMNIDGMADDDVVSILMGDCVGQQYDTMGELDVEKEEQAKSIYAVFRSMGFNNASIAGILGNMDKESGLDSSAIEGIFTEYGFLGTKKAEALLSLSNYTENILFPKYVNNGVSINKNGYKTTDIDGKTIYYCGIGLVQWTGPNAKDLLNAANTLSFDWYDMNFQLAYLMSDSFYRAGFFTGWLSSQVDETGDFDTDVETARDNGVKYAHEFEGNYSHDDERADAAESWYNIIWEWGDDQVDDTFVDTIVDLATELGATINFLDIQNAQYRCLNGNVFDNSSLAAAAVSFAWPTQEQSYNNGTNLYQTVHDGLWPHDLTYKACDRVVAAAVMWSGTDDDYKLGTANQYPYLESSSKWEKIGTTNNVSVSDLQPGDVFCRVGHTFIFTGESAIQAAYAAEAKPGSNSVSGSLGTRSAACDSSANHYIGGSNVFGVYRCIAPDNSDTYKHIAAGASN